MRKNTSVIGTYKGRATVSDVIDALTRAGYLAEDISVLSSENHGSRDFAREKHTKEPAEAGIGAAVGAVVGAALDRETRAVMGFVSNVYWSALRKVIAGRKRHAGVRTYGATECR